MDKVSFKTDIYMGNRALDRLCEIREKKVFVITDPFMVSSGGIEQITNRLHKGNNEVCVFSDIVPDPPIETVVAGVKEIEAFRPDIMIALGGGSAIDAAKAIKEFSLKIIGDGRMPFIAIPTTSGTGSEVTSFSVITDRDKHIKYPLVADTLLPEEAILDPELVKTVPKAVTADTGLDVLTHALEAYVSIRANEISDALAEKAVFLVFEYLQRAYDNGNDMEAREKMHIASCIAGMAFNLVGLGLNHGIAHVCGAKFHIPHGRMNSILLPAVIEYNADVKGYESRDCSLAAKKYATLAKRLGLAASNPRTGVKSLIRAIENLQKQMDMPTCLRACGVSYTKIEDLKESIAQAALQDGCTKTNPKQPTAKEIQKIILKIYN
ncbi:1-propanol dehydrogenase PduQ [Microbacteriaceae bacterium 4G12]